MVHEAFVEEESRVTKKLEGAAIFRAVCVCVCVCVIVKPGEPAV